MSPSVIAKLKSPTLDMVFSHGLVFSATIESVFKTVVTGNVIMLMTIRRIRNA